MSINEAQRFFKNHNLIMRKLNTLSDVGLGYIKLGQQATTLSGGESQRVKLAAELSKVNTGRTLYILDEPTTGLHFEDINMLLNVLHGLADKGNTVIVIEHNLDIIKSADWIVDLGPEGGDKGGEIIGAGTPEELIKNKKSYTGQFLKNILKNENKILLIILISLLIPNRLLNLDAIYTKLNIDKQSLPSAIVPEQQNLDFCWSKYSRKRNFFIKKLCQCMESDA